MQNASPSHKVSWNQLRKRCKDNDLVFSPSKDFKSLILHHLDVIKESPKQSLSPKQEQMVRKAFGSELGETLIHKRYTQNRNRELNKLQRNLTDNVIFKRLLLEAVQEPIKVSDYKPAISFKPKDNTVVVVLSDWHLGAKIDLTGNAYNKKIAEQRIATLFEASVKHIKEKQPNKVLIVNLGDLIENVQMRKNQAFSIELSLAQQIKFASEQQTNFVRHLATAFPKIEFSFTELEGNHDRFAPSKKDELPQDGVSLIGRTFVQLGCKDLKNVKVFDPDNEYRYLADINGHKLLFVHGDRDKLADSNILGKLSTFERQPLDALIGGHLHSIQIREQGNDQFVCQAGSLIGPSDYSESLGVTSSPSQLLIDVSKTISPQIVLV